MKKPKLDKPAKPTKQPDIAPAGGNSADPERRALFLSDLEKWQKLEAVVKKASANRREHEKQIKDDGFSMGQIKLAAQLSQPEGEVEYRMKVSSELLAAQWVGAAIGSQLQLFLDDKDRTPLVDSAWDEGIQAAMSGKQAKPPYDPGSEGYSRFLDGFHSVTEQTSRSASSRLDIGHALTVDKPTIAEEHFARLIAMWHGQKIVVGSKTVAATRGYDSGWGWELDRYVDNHWQEYLPAAQAVLDAR